MFDKVFIKIENSASNKDFEKLINETLDKIGGWDIYKNTKASIMFIVKNVGEYFSKLPDTFLGRSKGFGIPNSETDHFANNLYRLRNSLNECSQYINSSYTYSEEFKQLIDIRTIIVHSGENISQFESDLFKKKMEIGYKDLQFNGVINKDNQLGKFPDGQDYKIHIGADKHDKYSKKPNNNVYYDNEQENQLELDIFLSHKTVQQIVFTELAKFNKQTDLIENKTPLIRKPLNAGITNHIFLDGDKIDFVKLIEMVKERGNGNSGYFVEDGKEYSYLFGIQRLYNYVQKARCLVHINERDDISESTLQIIEDEISKVVHGYVNWFNKNDVEEEIPDLNVLHIFGTYLPNYKAKQYYEGEKLFTYIARTFNTSENYGCVDLDYLFKFYNEVSVALGRLIKLPTGNENDLVCEYIVEAVEVFNKQDEMLNRPSKE